MKYNPGFSHKLCRQNQHTWHCHLHDSASSIFSQLLPNWASNQVSIAFFGNIITSSRPVVFKLESPVESSEGLVKTHLYCRVSDSVSLKCGPRICISDNFPREVSAVGEVFLLWETLISFIPGKHFFLKSILSKDICYSSSFWDTRFL